MILFVIESAGNARVFRGSTAVEALTRALDALPVPVCRRGVFLREVSAEDCADARALLASELKKLEE